MNQTLNYLYLFILYKYLFNIIYFYQYIIISLLAANIINIDKLMIKNIILNYKFYN